MNVGVMLAIVVVAAVDQYVSSQTTPGVSEPFEGTWIMNVGRSSFSDAAPQRARTLVIERKGGDFLYSIATTNADGSTVRIRYSVPVEGGAGRVMEGPYDGVVHRRIDAYTREAEYLRGGKTMVAFTGRVSEDRRVLRIIVKNLID